MTEATSRAWPLPPGMVPIGLSRVQAAAYIGVSPPLFDILVSDGRMPAAKRIRRRLVWDRRAVEDAFARLGTEPQVGGSPKTDEIPGDDDPVWDTFAP